VKVFRGCGQGLQREGQQWGMAEGGSDVQARREKALASQPGPSTITEPSADAMGTTLDSFLGVALVDGCKGQVDSVMLLDHG